MSHIVDKNIRELVHGLQRSLETNRYVELKGLLQSLDPRLKLLMSVPSLLLVASSQQLQFAILFYLGVLFLGILSRIPVKVMLRIWIAFPFFSLFLALPLIVSAVTPGISILSIMNVSITLEGIIRALVFIFRIAGSVSVVQLLMLTTRWDHILKSLITFRISSGIIFVLSITYRYIYVLMSNVLDMMNARKSRLVGVQTIDQQRNWIGALAGTALVKSLALSHDVSDAMVSRGFDGRIRTYHQLQFSWFDYFVLVIFSIILLYIYTYLV